MITLRQFDISDDEWERFQWWHKAHKCELSKAREGQYTVLFTPTGIATFVSVRCACGAEVLLTDRAKI